MWSVEEVAKVMAAVAVKGLLAATRATEDEDPVRVAVRPGPGVVFI